MEVFNQVLPVSYNGVDRQKIFRIFVEDTQRLRMTITDGETPCFLILFECTEQEFLPLKMSLNLVPTFDAFHLELIRLFELALQDTEKIAIQVTTNAGVLLMSITEKTPLRTIDLLQLTLRPGTRNEVNSKVKDDLARLENQLRKSEERGDELHSTLSDMVFTCASTELELAECQEAMQQQNQIVLNQDVDMKNMKEFYLKKIVFQTFMLNAAKGKMTRKLRELETLNSEIERFTRELELKTKEVSFLKTDLQRANIDISTLRARLQMLHTARKDAVTDELASLRAKFVAQTEAINEAKENLNLARENSEALINRLNDLNVRLIAKERGMKSLDSVYRDCLKKNEHCNMEIGELSRQRVELITKNAMLENEVARLKLELGAVRIENNNLNKEMTQCTSEKEYLKSNNTQLTETLEVTKKQLNDQRKAMISEEQHVREENGAYWGKYIEGLPAALERMDISADSSDGQTPGQSSEERPGTRDTDRNQQA